MGLGGSKCTNLVSGMICRNGVSRNIQYQLLMDSRRERIKPWVGVDVVALGVAAGVAKDVSVRDKNAVSGISNKYVISMVRYAVKANFVENAMGWSTRYKQLHTEKIINNVMSLVLYTINVNFCHGLVH